MSLLLETNSFTVDREVLLNEYWEPAQENNWCQFEFLAESMTILEILNEPNFIEVSAAKVCGMRDMDLANQLFNS